MHKFHFTKSKNFEKNLLNKVCVNICNKKDMSVYESKDFLEITSFLVMDESMLLYIGIFIKIID